MTCKLTHPHPHTKLDEGSNNYDTHTETTQTRNAEKSQDSISFKAPEEGTLMGYVIKLI